MATLSYNSLIDRDTLKSLTVTNRRKPERPALKSTEALESSYNEENGGFSDLSNYIYKDDSKVVYLLDVKDNSWTVEGIHYYDKNNLQKLVIPEYVEGKPVTSIRESAFEECYTLTDVFIPKTIKSIGSYAFSRCSSLYNLTFDPENEVLSHLGPLCFQQCCLLEISFPEKIPLKNLLEKTFYKCISLQKVRLSASIDTIKPQVFEDCIALKDINLQNIKYLEDSCFSNSGLERIEIYQRDYEIHPRAFSSCYSLEEIIFNEKSCEGIGIAIKTLPSLKRLVFLKGSIDTLKEMFFENLWVSFLDEECEPLKIFIEDFPKDIDIFNRLEKITYIKCIMKARYSFDTLDLYKELFSGEYDQAGDIL